MFVTAGLPPVFFCSSSPHLHHASRSTVPAASANPYLSQLSAGPRRFPAFHHRRYAHCSEPALKPQTLNDSLARSLFVVMQHVPALCLLPGCPCLILLVPDLPLSCFPVNQSAFCPWLEIAWPYTCLCPGIKRVFTCYSCRTYHELWEC